MTEPQPSETSGTFGSSRGSGLARGKRAHSPAAPAPASAQSQAEYKPTALEVIVPQRDYQNPFASESAAETPAAVAAFTPPPSPPVESAVVPPQETAASPSPAAAMRAETAKPEPEAEAPARPAPPAAKPEIRILPTPETRRPAVSWDGSTAGSDDRPAFRPARRDFRQDDRDPQPKYNEGSRSAEFRENAGTPGNAPSIPPANETKQPAGGGFFGWLKGLFGKKPAPAPEQTETRDEFRHEGDRDGQRRRRRRGGRGHSRGESGQGPTGNREPRSEGNPAGNAGHSHSEGQAGQQHRRRHRGGRGRNRGGDRRSEGQQGGGAI